ncbi:MAG: hypothetical protein ACJ788_20600 [Ktedonobacteraceae bacterium]|jgi:hypothetical protein
MKLEQRVAVITGVGSGIGQAMVLLFEEKLSVKESRTAKYSRYPSALAGKEDDSGEHQPDMGLDHPVLWQQKGKLQYFTSEPYYVNHVCLFILFD